MEIERPIFIVGNIRSGTTILYELLAVHPGLCWFSNLTNEHPRSRRLPFLHRILDLPLLGRGLKRSMIAGRRLPRIVPHPHEGDRIYHDYCGFGRNPDGLETYLDDEMERRLKSVIAAHLRGTGKPRFLSKQTANNRRLELLERMFPGALYVHCLRDGRAVAASTLRVPWWRDTHVWWLGKKARAWEEEGGEPVELAGLYWKRTVEEIRRFAPQVGDRFLEVRYEELTADTRGTIGRIMDFCLLRRDGAYIGLLPERLPDRNYKWREQLSPREKEVLSQCIGPFLAELGYRD